MNDIERRKRWDQREQWIEMKNYMRRLENEVLIPGITDGFFGTRIKIPARQQKLSETLFGAFIGPDFSHSGVIVVDYYGLIKRSFGFLKEVERLAKEGVEVKSIVAPVAYFAGIKIEYLASKAPDMVDLFPTFKAYLVSLRGFPLLSLDRHEPR